jgi:GTP-binding protein
VIENLRNIAIIAHVDHGKTTLVDQLLQQSGTLGERAAAPERVMDSNELERERGITILSKNTALRWNDGEQTWRINIVDTPGHADFGGEVERILSMVDSVLLLVDAVDGPMPQTRFVTQKAFQMGFKPIVVINKIDRDGARPHWVLDQTFELFDQLGATDEQLDFPVVYASALKGYAGMDEKVQSGDMRPLFETIIERVAPPPVNIDGPFQMRISSLDYSAYVGVIGIGRVQRGAVRPNQQICVIDCDGRQRNARVLQILGFHGLNRVEVESAQAGDIIAITGVENLQISDTLCDRAAPEALPALTVDEPTISMTFRVNNSPFAGREGKYLTSRQLRERLLGERRGELQNMQLDGRGRVRLDYLIPARGLIGFQSEFRTLTAGTGLMFHVFDHYGPWHQGDISRRNNGVLISNSTGKALAYALFNLQERGRMIIEPNVDVYEGQVIGLHSRSNDLTVNPLKGKQLTNIRTVLKDEAVQLAAPINLTLEQALEFIEDDELVEVTPKAIRIRKTHLLEHERKRAGRQKAEA